MLRIVDAQSTGKTKQLLTFAKENDCTVICLMPSRMQDKAVRYGLGHVRCVSYDEFLEQYQRNNVAPAKYVIDEPERLLQLMFQNDAVLYGYDMTV